MRLVLFGECKFLTKYEIYSLVYGVGGKVQPFLSDSTDYLVIGDGKCSLYERVKKSEIFLETQLLNAKGAGIKVLNEKAFVGEIVHLLQEKIRLSNGSRVENA